MIQLVTNRSIKKESVSSYEIEVNPLSSPRSFGEFPLSIIDLAFESNWQSSVYNTEVLDVNKDLASISKMLTTKGDSKVLIVLPQNGSFLCLNQRPTLSYTVMLKDLPDFLEGYNYLSLFRELGISTQVEYENATTEVEGRVFHSDFCFTPVFNKYAKTISKSGRYTTISFDEIQVFVTTLDVLKNWDALMHYLKHVIMNDPKEEVPEWIHDVFFDDDELQKRTIEEKEAEIETAREVIGHSSKKLAENLRYKSMLYTNGDELVEVVFSVLERILSCDLSSFVDEKKEDFLIQLPKVTFIGEIKGVTSNIKSEHISQLDVHYQGYLGKLSEEGRTETVAALLIMNPFRTKSLDQRAPVHEIQIALAERNGSLIIETETLLRLYEKVLNGSLSSEQCIEILSTHTGLLKVDDFS